MSLLKNLNLPAPAGPGAAPQPAADPEPEKTATKAAPAAKHSHSAKKAGVVSEDAKLFTAEVATAMARLEPLITAKAPEVPGLRKAILAAGIQGQHAKEREAARKALGLVTAQMQLLQQSVTQRSVNAKAEADAENAKPKERLYDVSVGGKQFRGATAAEVGPALETVLDALEAEIKRGFDAHVNEMNNREEGGVSAAVSGGITSLKAVVSGDDAVDIMDTDIWNAPKNQLSQARAALRDGDIEKVTLLVPMIKRSCRLAMAKVSKYNADSIDSAETAIEGLTEVKKKSADFVKKGAETLGGKPLGVAVGAVYTSAQEAAEQASAVHIAGIQEEIDWGAVAAQGVASAASDIVGILLKGAMAEKFAGLFGPYLKKANFGEEELEAMGKAVGLTGPLARDALMTRAQKEVKDFLLEKAQGLIKSAVSDLIKGKKAGDPPKPIDELMLDVVKKMATDKLWKMFVQFVIERAAK